MTESIPRHIISKSSFLRGCQCPKSLCLSKKHPEWGDEHSKYQQTIFNQGTSIGILARDLFPCGIDASPIDTYHYQDSVLLTKELIDKNTPIIYETSFQHDGVLVASDIIIYENGKWKCFELKSSTEIKDVYLLDVALQYFIITQSGILLDDISIIFINNQYVRDGDLELKKLFTIVPVMNQVLELQDFIKVKIEELKSVVLEKSIPIKDIGSQCLVPYDCDFITHCWKHVPEVSVFNLVRLSSGKKFELYQEGILEYKDLPKDYRLTEGQKMQVESSLKNKSYIDKKSIKNYLAELHYPIYYLDFETIQPAVPLFSGTKPYQQIPTQYSLHYKKECDANETHSDFLACANQEDPRLALVEALLEATSDPGTILTYNQTFEVSRLKELAIAFPKYKSEIEERISRVADLMLPFQKRWYYAPEMQGSYSIKVVLPALIPSMDYEHLEIGDGGTASTAFMSLYQNSNQEEVNKIRTALLAYCKQDTYAMVKLLEFLEKIN
jgi:hypothetical protein